MSSSAVRHDQDGNRYEYVIDGHVIGTVEYRGPAGRRELHHTEVDPSARRRGIAAELVGAVLDDMRGRGEQVVPTCPYVRDFIANRPEYQDLLSDGEPS